MGDKAGEAAALHTCACLALDKFFKESNQNRKALIKSGFNQKNFVEPELKEYKESIEMVEKAYEIFTEIGDKAGIEMVSDTMANINIKATMLNDPDETRQITKNGQVIEVVEIWNKTEVKLEITRDGMDTEKILKTKYEVVPMEKKEKEGDAAAAVADAPKKAEI